MNQAIKSAIIVLHAFCLTMLVPSILVAEENSSEQSFEVHKLSFSLGTFSAFSEMVGFGVKALALSSALTPEEMELFRPEAEKVAAKWGVQLYFEPELMITDLFSPSITEGKHLFLIYRTGSDGTLDQYLGLKKRKEELIASDNYTREAREQISWEFGKLLSYPNSKITSLIEKTNAGK